MNKFRFTVNALAIAIFTLAFASIAQAQATRTWVSGVGDDANPCSRTAPCKTFAGAISKTATNGEINALDNGGFGGVTITKAITIEGGGQIAGVLVSGTNAIIINAPTGDNVTLRNLDINGVGAGLVGVKILAANRVYIDNCHIYGFRGANGRGISDERTTASPIPMLWVNNTDVRNNAEGVVIGNGAASLRAMIEGSRITGNTTNGVRGRFGSVTMIRSSQISGNLADGARIEDANTQMNLIGCNFSNNQGTAVNNVSGTQLSLADTTVINNITGVAGTLTSFGNNNVRNNAGGNALPAAVGQQ
jgi:hypothetical protein